MIYQINNSFYGTKYKAVPYKSPVYFPSLILKPRSYQRLLVHTSAISAFWGIEKATSSTGGLLVQLNLLLTNRIT